MLPWSWLVLSCLQEEQEALGRFGLFLADALFPVLQFPACPSKAACHSWSSCFAAWGNCPEGSWPQSVVILKASTIRDPRASKDYYSAEPTEVYCQNFVLFPSFILPFSRLDKCSSFVLLLQAMFSKTLTIATSKILVSDLYNLF